MSRAVDDGVVIRGEVRRQDRGKIRSRVAIKVKKHRQPVNARGGATKAGKAQQTPEERGEIRVEEEKDMDRGGRRGALIRGGTCP